MKHASITGLVFALALASGCSGDDTSTATLEKTPATHTGDSRVSDSNAFSTQVRALEKAEQVEQIYADRKRNLDAQMP